MKLFFSSIFKLVWLAMFFTPISGYSNSLYGSSKLSASHELEEQEQARIAVASNFIKPMQQLVAAFERQSPHTISVSYSASGKLYAQILNGAPFDVFLSADQVKPNELIKQKKADEMQRYTYAQGKLVLWSSIPLFLNNTADNLLQNNYRKIALANPRFAPYGIAAKEVLTNLGILEQSKSKWVLGESISQTFQFVATGNADLGFIAFSQKPETGSYWIIPENLYSPIKQDAVLLSHAKINAAALDFFAFLKSNEAKNIIQSHHYIVD
jgi:molybdate transport system substrate-binding protein